MMFPAVGKFVTLHPTLLPAPCFLHPDVGLWGVISSLCRLRFRFAIWSKRTESKASVFLAGIAFLIARLPGIPQGSTTSTGKPPPFLLIIFWLLL